MTSIRFTITFVTASIITSTLPVDAADRAGASGESPRTVVVELFTSQGCSSCPPADRLLSGLAGHRRIGGEKIEVIPLAFHVDYWDAIGWPDPFASPRWTARQNVYARWFEERRIYTPQLVVAGGRHAVGSSKERVEALIDWAARKPPKVALAVEASSVDRQLAIEVAAERIDGDGPAATVFVAVHDGDHRTEVGAGENARRTLENERVVRHLAPVVALTADQRGIARGSASVAIDPAWKASALGIVVFAQDLETGAIVGAASASPRSP